MFFEKIKKLNPANLLIACFYIWGVFSFFSNSILSLQHLLIFLFVVFALRALRLKSIPRSSLSLFAFVFVALVSVFVNWASLKNPFWNILKIKYFLFSGFLGWGCFQYSHILKKHLGSFFSLFILSSSLASLYGLGKCSVSNFLESGVECLPSGFFGMRMSYTYLLQFSVLLLFFLLLSQSLSKSLLLSCHKRLKFIFDRKTIFVFFIISVVAMYFAKSRGPVIGFIVGCPFLFLEQKKSFKIISSLSFLLLLCAFAFVLSKRFEKNLLFQNVQSQSNLERLSQFKVAEQMFKERPLFGIGFRAIEEKCADFKEKYNIDQKQFNGHAHNNFLELAASTGFLGLFVFLLWIFFWMKEIAFLNDPMRFFYFSAIIAFLVSGLFQSTIIDSEFVFSFFALYGLSKVPSV
jgi:O-antigen ligase